MVDFFSPFKFKVYEMVKAFCTGFGYTGEVQLGGVHGFIHRITEYQNCLPPTPHQSSTAVFRFTVKDPKMQNPYEVCNVDTQVSNSGND